MWKKVILLSLVIFVLSPTDAWGNVRRISGSNRYQTNIMTIQESFSSTDKVILVSGENWPDAIGAGVLATQEKAALFICPKNNITTEIYSSLLNLGVKDIIIIGGAGSISENVENILKNKGYNVDRISGINRYQTAIKVAEKIPDMTNETMFLVSGENFPDALTVNTIAASTGYPILMAGKSSISQEAIDFIQKRQPQRIIIVGGTGAISASVEETIKQYSDITRIGGINRYETAIRLMEWYQKEGGEINQIKIASGENWPDALGSSQYNNDNSMLLLSPYTANSIINDKIKSTLPETITIFGGLGVISLSQEMILENILVPTYQITDLSLQEKYDIIARKYPFALGAVTIYGDAKGYQAVCYYKSGKIVVDKNHTSDINRILSHEMWHIIDWNDNGIIDWGENIPPQ